MSQMNLFYFRFGAMLSKAKCSVLRRLFLMVLGDHTLPGIKPRLPTC